MAGGKMTSGMWRVDPRKWSQVIDRFGRPVASVEAVEADAHTNASVIAAAPDMFELLEGLETNGSVPDDVLEKVRLVLRRARGQLGLAFFSSGPARFPGSGEWLKFATDLWEARPEGEE